MNFKKQAAALALALTMTLSLSVPALAAEPADRETSAETAAAYAQQYGLASSVSYAVWENGKITLSGWQGAPEDAAESGTPAGPADENRDLYGIGSVSKMYVTAAAMKLVEQGKLSLDAPVTRYLKDFKMADPRYTSITVRMLLNHSSGLMGVSGENVALFADDDEQATDQLLERLSTQRLKADPGAFSVYCNDGFTLAQLVVEAVSGQDFMDYVRSALLKPAGLEDTFAPQDKFSTERLALTYSAGDPRPLPQDCLGIVGTGGMYATAEDMAAFGGALTGAALLSTTTTSAMAAPEYDRGIWPNEPLGAVSYGLGWDSVEFWPFQQNDIQCLVKGGDTMSYHAALLILPEHDMAAAVLTSGGVSLYNEMAAAQMLVDALEEKGVKIDQTAPTLPTATLAKMPAELVKESGYYGTTNQQLQATVSADGKLVIHQINIPDIPDQTFSYYSDGSFRDPTGAVATKLVRESNGATYFYQQSYSEIPGLGILPGSDYLLAKMPESKPTAEAQAAWTELATMGMVPLGEKYSSQTYLALSGVGAEEAQKNVPGYVGANRIVSPTEIRYELPIGRDAGDMTVSDGLFMAAGIPYQLEKDIKDLYTGNGWAVATVKDDGYARWFNTGKAAGKTMRVTLPKDAGFWVYNGELQLVASSVLWGDTSVELPKDGSVVFAGEPGAQFHLRFTA